MERSLPDLASPVGSSISRAISGSGVAVGMGEEVGAEVAVRSGIAVAAVDGTTALVPVGGIVAGRSAGGGLVRSGSGRDAVLHAARVPVNARKRIKWRYLTKMLRCIDFLQYADL